MTLDQVEHPDLIAENASFPALRNVEIAIADQQNTADRVGGYNDSSSNITNTRMTSKTDLEKEIANTMNFIWTFINCLFVVGQFLGGFCSKYVLEYLGRKKGFLFNNLFTVTGSVLVLVAPFVHSPVCVMASRFFYGLQSGRSRNKLTLL